WSSLCYRPEELEHIDWGLFNALVDRMDQFCVAHGAKFIMYAHPSIAEVWTPFISQVERAQQLGTGEYDRYALEKRLSREMIRIDFCPLVQYFVDQQDRGPFHLLPRDPHCNGTGYKLTAEVIAAHLMHDNYLSQIH